MVERMLWAGNLLNCLKDTLGESSCISCYLHYRNVRGKDILEKLSVSVNFWRTKGGCLNDNTIQKLIAAKVPIIVMDNSNYKTSKKPVRMEYQDDINIAEFKEIPTYKRMCICILKNDHACKYMGFSPTKEEISKRSQIMEQYKNILQ